ncbi:coenzyme F420-0:L-glutamate ligase [Candidatus Nomurabacteria bacterium]|nr:coenzyme F420-0:L-glutamate ligase [Candidatus Nomurabacteria bacterium]
MQVKSIKTKIFREHEDLFSFVLKYVKIIRENSILVVTSKIVSLSEGRVAGYKGEKTRANLIKTESDFILENNILFTIKNNIVMAFAGVDESNGNGKLTCLPKDSYKSAETLRKKLMRKFRLRNLGVLITDSGFMPLRNGAVGMAVGYAGFRGVRNYIGKKDIFGRILKMSKTNVADSLAATAVLTMGEGKEQTPLAIIYDAPVVFTDKTKRGEISVDQKKDMYGPLFANIKKYAKKNKR